MYLWRPDPYFVIWSKKICTCGDLTPILLFQTCSFSEQEIRQLIDYIQKSGVSVENWGIDIIWWNIFNQRKPSCDVSK